MTLADLASGEHARVLAVATVNGGRRRLAELGVRPGAAVEVLRRAPLGGALAVRVGDGTLAIGVGDARDVRVEPVDRGR